MSYRRAWQLVEALNRSFAEPVVVTEIGGRQGGGTTVTAFGRAVVAEFHAMEERASLAIAADLKRYARRNLRKFRCAVRRFFLPLFPRCTDCPRRR